MSFVYGFGLGIIFGLIISFIFYILFMYLERDIKRKEIRYIDIISKKLYKGELDARTKNTSDKRNR